ncbi:GNAT family N-acetyltransferase [Acetanaerobacterium elongatum]|uniref:GNAT acetyltransferase n=1 Tax=Acetanaerobacterium elongatum TaxID=258515 RepID=A0A1G9YR22_9FIRM|nr:GNAT family N-acetyltransferase [Acetanaerobacterium elongatum]SDN11649.1 GNAT acetyltransferase [Acetanaerobacterium elongatum]
MVHIVDDINEADFLRLARENPVYGAAMLANYAVYHRDDRYLSQWVICSEQNPPHLAVQLYQQSLTVCCADDDIDSELFAAFLSIVPEYRSIVAPKAFIESMPERVKAGRQLRHGKAMVLPHKSLQSLPEVPDGIQLIQPPNLQQLFKLLCECSSDYRQFADYNFWYTDLSFRLRHNLAKAAAVKQDGVYVSAACAFYLTGSAVIRDVCTLNGYQRRGYAKAVTAELTRALLKDNLQPLLFSVSQEADRLYQTVGFEPCSEWAGLYK